MHGFKCRWRRDKLRHLAAKFHQLEAKPRFPPTEKRSQFWIQMVWGYYASTRIRKHNLALLDDGLPTSPDLCFLQGTLLCLAKQTEQKILKFAVKSRGVTSLPLDFKPLKTIQTPKPRRPENSLNRLNPPLTHHQLASIQLVSQSFKVWCIGKTWNWGHRVASSHEENKA